MDLIIIEQIFSSVLWRRTGGKESLTKGEVQEITLDEFMEYLGSIQGWIVDNVNAATGTIVIVRHSQADIITHRTTIECDPKDYDELSAALSSLPKLEISSEAS